MKAKTVAHLWGRRKYRAEPVTWLPKAAERLRLLAPFMTVAELAVEFGRSPEAVRTYCRRHKISVRKATKPGLWSPEDDARLEEMAGNIPVAQIAAALGRSETAIRSRCKVKGLSVAIEPRRMWTAEEEAFLHAHHQSLTIGQMAEQLGRNHSSTAQKCQSMALDCPYTGEKNHSTRYSYEDVELCRALYDAGLARKLIAEKMEIPYQRVCDFIRFAYRRHG